MKLLKSSEFRDLRALVNSNPSVGDITNYGFRSAKEVEFYLKEMEKRVKSMGVPSASVLAALAAVPSFKTLAAELKINRHAKPVFKDADAPREFKSGEGTKTAILVDKIQVQNTEKLGQQFDLVRKLQENLDVLESLDAQVVQSFPKEAKALQAHINKLKTGVEKKLKDVLSFLSSVAKGKQPQAFNAAVSSTIKAFLKRIEGKYKTATESTYVFTRRRKSEDQTYFVFQHYLVLTNFSNDSSTFSYPLYCIVFTAAISESKQMSMHVTTFHSKRMPGTFKFGSSFTSADTCKKELDVLLDVDKMVDSAEGRKLPARDFSPKDFSNGSLISKVKVDGNRIRFTFKPVVKGPKIESVIQRLFLDLRTALGLARTTTLKYKLGVEGNSQTAEFLLLPADKQRLLLDEEKVELLKNKFGFDEDDLATLVRVINKGY